MNKKVDKGSPMDLVRPVLLSVFGENRMWNPSADPACPPLLGFPGTTNYLNEKEERERNREYEESGGKQKKRASKSERMERNMMQRRPMSSACLNFFHCFWSSLRFGMRNKQVSIRQICLYHKKYQEQNSKEVFIRKTELGLMKRNIMREGKQAKQCSFSLRNEEKMASKKGSEKKKKKLIKKLLEKGKDQLVARKLELGTSDNHSAPQRTMDLHGIWLNHLT